MERNDFANWLRTELGRYLVALDLEQISKARYKGEELRRHILECFGEAASSATRSTPAENDELEENQLKIKDSPAIKTIGGIKFSPRYQEESEVEESTKSVQPKEGNSRAKASSFLDDEASSLELESKPDKLLTNDSLSGVKAEQ